MPNEGIQCNDESDMILDDLKNGRIKNVSNRLSRIEKSKWPVEILLPFTLQALLRKLHWNIEEHRFITKCFRLFSHLRCLSTVDRDICLELFRLSIFTEAVATVSSFTSQREEKRLQLSDDVMRLFKLMMEEKNPERRYVRQFTYIVTVCERFSRLINFHEKSSRYVKNLTVKLRKRSAPVVNRFILDM